MCCLFARKIYILHSIFHIEIIYYYYFLNGYLHLKSETRKMENLKTEKGGLKISIIKNNYYVYKSFFLFTKRPEYKIVQLHISMYIYRF